MNSRTGPLAAGIVLAASRALAVGSTDEVVLNRFRMVKNDQGGETKKYHVHKGNILSDNWKGIEIVGPGGRVQISPDDIKDVKYADTPIQYPSAKPFIKNRNYAVALQTYLIPALANCRSKLLRQYILYDIAYCHERMDESDKAIEAYQRLLREIPDTRFLPQVVERVVLVHISREEYDKALKLIRKLKGLGPDWALRGALLEGLVLIAKKQFRRADRLFKEIYDENQGSGTPEAAEALVGRALAHIGMNRCKEAAGFARKAVREAKGEPGVSGAAYVALGDAYFEMAKGADAAALNDALFAYLHVPVLYGGTQKSEAKALFRAGQCFEFRNERSRAEIMFKRAWGKYPSSTWGKKAAKRLGS